MYSNKIKYSKNMEKRKQFFSKFTKFDITVRMAWMELLQIKVLHYLY